MHVNKNKRVADQDPLRVILDGFHTFGTGVKKNQHTY